MGVVNEQLIIVYKKLYGERLKMQNYNMNKTSKTKVNN